MLNFLCNPSLCCYTVDDWDEFDVQFAAPISYRNVKGREEWVERRETFTITVKQTLFTISYKVTIIRCLPIHLLIVGMVS